MVDAIWFYEKDFDAKKGKLYPLSPVGSYETEITDLDFDDTERIEEVVADLKRMGADFIAVLPDHRHYKGFLYPHIAVSFPNAEQEQKCIGKYGLPRRSLKYWRPETTKLVYDEWGGFSGRTLTDEEYDDLTVEDLLNTLYQSSWSLGVIDSDDDIGFTKEARDELEKKSAEQLREFIRENGGLIVLLDKPSPRYVYPVFSKGPRKGLPNYKKEADIFLDQWYDIEIKQGCVLK